jgi:Beta-propeller repeat
MFHLTCRLLGALRPRIACCRPNPILVVANQDAFSATNQSITQYEIVDGVGPNGNVAPSWIIAGPATTLQLPGGVKVHAGKIFVADIRGNAVTVFSVGTGGNLSPLFSISGGSTELSEPYGIAIDRTGNVFVTGSVPGGDDQVTVYAAGSSGNVAPIRRIAGNNTGLSNPTGIAVDGTGRTYVTNAGRASSITVYDSGATGNVAPIATITGPNTGLGKPQGIALDSHRKLYVTTTRRSAPTTL